MAQDNKQWYYTFYEAELEMLTSPYQLLVYTAIKSYLGNGTLEKKVSIRDIQKRCRLSFGKVQSTIKELLNSNLLQIVGEEREKGGPGPVYKLIIPRSVEIFKRSSGDQLKIVSDQVVKLSDHTLGIKLGQTNKLSVVVNQISLLLGKKFSIVDGQPCYLKETTWIPISNPTAFLKSIESSSPQLRIPPPSPKTNTAEQSEELPSGAFNMGDGTWLIVSEDKGQHKELVLSEEEYQKGDYGNR